MNCKVGKGKAEMPADYFNAYQEAMDYEENARFDYVHEAYAGMEEDPENLAAEQAMFESIENVRTQDEIEASGPTFNRFRDWSDFSVYDDCPF
jgi:3-hydroxyacyl-CoA dehydrogenase